METKTMFAAASDEEELLQMMTDCFKAFGAGDYKLMSSFWLHSPKLSMFEPFIPFLFQGWDEVNNYIKTIEGVPAGINVFQLHHNQVTKLTDDVALITNYNHFVQTDPNTKIQNVYEIRGTFVFQRIEGKWLIVHEHSSMLPTK